MALRLLLISVDGTLAHGGQADEKISNSLARLARELHAVGVRTALWSNKPWVFGNDKQPIQQWFSEKAGVEVNAHGYYVDGSPPRRTANSAQPILEKYGVQRYETVLVGGMEEDMLAGVQNQLLLLRPEWYQQTMEYGFPIASVSELARFCFVFGLRRHPVFWRINDGDLDISAGGPFSTYYPSYAAFGTDAKAFAKQGLGHADFWFYFTVSSLYFSGLLEGVNYICSYPGHSPASDPDKNGMASLLTRLGKCFRKPYYHDLLVRHSLAPKSQYIKAPARTFSAQLNTLRLQRRPHRNLSELPNRSSLSLHGKTVLVVDDFVTSGRSSESARVLIQAAGGKVRLYSWLKTISASYERISILPQLDPYSTNTLLHEPSSKSYSYASSIVAPGAPTEIQTIFDQYIDWK